MPQNAPLTSPRNALPLRFLVVPLVLVSLRAGAEALASVYTCSILRAART